MSAIFKIKQSSDSLQPFPYVRKRAVKDRCADMACIYIQQDTGQNTWDTTIRIGTVTGGRGGIEMATVAL